MNWKEKFKNKYFNGEFNTESDIEDFAIKYNLRHKEVFHFLDEIQTIGTKCESLNI